MNDRDKRILEMRNGGASLRKIGAALGVSHVCILHRLRAIEARSQLVTNEENKEVLGEIEEKENTTSGLNPYLSRSSKESDNTVNQVVTKRPPSLGEGEGGNRLPKDILTPCKGPETGGHRCLGDLFGAIKEFLESHGVNVYRMQGGYEGYQAKGSNQIVRIYVTRRNEA